MKYMTINNRQVAFDDEKNVLQVIRKSGINLPTFCYHSELSTYGACRMCVVEDNRGRIFASCSETPRDGMVIFTNTPRLQHHRKMILELLLSSHCQDCATCHVDGRCTLQDLSRQLGVNYIRFNNSKEKLPIDESSDSIVIDPNKCILCGDCVRTCEEIQGMGILDFAHRGSKMRVMPAFNKEMAATDCVGCGQCRVACPTGAITVKHNISPIWHALADPDIRVVVQIAPAVRIAVGDLFGIPKGENSLGKLVTALRMMGFDEIYDTNFGADLTVIEESKEFIERLESGENLPLFTSCCPAWVKFCETKHPDLVKHIGAEGLKEITVPFGDRELKIAIVNGLKNADNLMKKIKAGEVYYDFVEVMACKRGCVAGGGQPLPIGPRTRKARLEALYNIDKQTQIKRSEENPLVMGLYDGLLKGKVHKLLHNEKH